VRQNGTDEEELPKEIIVVWHVVTNLLELVRHELL
jgi:hypothetical protein